jgi:outer membrane protein OmpA-like peptidoglycan-associated protein
MKKLLKAISGVLVAAGLLAVPSMAQAQSLTLRLEPGVAVPLGSPQSDRFKVGGGLAVKPELGLGSYLSVGPSVSFLALPSSISGIDTGTAWAFGGFGRLKRPHDEKNTGHGFSAVSPWVDADLQYVRTDPLNRLGWAVGIGAAVPTSDSRQLWVGPFARYQSVFQEEGHRGFDTSDAKIFIAGLSIEIDPAGYRKKAAPPPPAPPPPAPPPMIQPLPVPPPPVVVTQDVDIEVKQVIQFAWDSPVLDATANEQLNAVVKKITSSKGFGAIKVEGHASSEGQVEHNNILSKKRAQSVADFLVAHGVPQDKVTVVGFGSNVPVASNKTEAGRVLNRRAEFVVKFTVTVTKESK